MNVVSRISRITTPFQFSSVAERFLQTSADITRRCIGRRSMSNKWDVVNRQSEVNGNGRIVVNRFENIIKSAEDKRCYRGLELNNGLRVVLVSDPLADKCAASINVNVGHLMDPRELPGLAHFCEHMLFLGTDKYPCENDYQKFISTHGGMTNAHTSTDSTNYHFDIAPDFLHGGLDRFAQFFLSPQFTESATEREVNAVDSEHANNLQSDGWRLVQLHRSLSNPNHDYSKFGSGNKKTLVEDAKAKHIEPRQALLKFHKQFYSSNIMGLSIIDKRSLDEMESELVTDLFGDIQNKNTQIQSWNEHPYGPDQLGYRVEVVPVHDLRSLSISFPFPDLQPYYRSQPDHYISHILGHEGANSLLSELKRRGWVSALSAGAMHLAKGFSVFNVDVDLSEEGLKHVEEIVQLVFQTIGMIVRAKPQQWLHNELKDLADLKFHFKDKEKTVPYAISLASRLYEVPFEHLLNAPYAMDEWRPDLIEMLLHMLTPDKMNLTVLSKSFANRSENEREFWYNTEYHKSLLTKEFIEKCKEAMTVESEVLKMPRKNDFIATQFEQKPRDQNIRKEPELLRDDKYIRLWYLQDNEYMLPKAVTYLSIYSPIAVVDPFRTFLTAMFAFCLEDAFVEETYDAELAGLHHTLMNSKNGLSLKISGYDEKQSIFATFLTERLANFEPNELRFDVLKEIFVRQLQNFQKEQPYNQAIFYTSLLLSQHSWSKQQLLSVAPKVTIDELKKFIPDLLSALYIEALVYGNVTAQEATELVDNVCETLKSARPVRALFSSELRQDREHRLHDQTTSIFERPNDTHSNSACEVIFQTGVQETRENMLLELLSQIMAEPAFNQLRTNEQLGYVVFSGPRRSNGCQALRFIVQGEKDPKFVEARIEHFIQSIREQIITMVDSEFIDHVEALATKRLEKPKRLTAQADRYWSEILTRIYHFNREIDEVADLRTITKQDLLEYIDRVIVVNGRERKKLIVMIKSDQCKEDLEGTRCAWNGLNVDQSVASQRSKMISSVEKFKDQLPLYPLPMAKIDIPPLADCNDNDVLKQ